MRKVNNPFVKMHNYCCFGCAPHNPIGLKLEFYEQEETVSCQWQPDTVYQGWNDVLHGGIQATLMDEISSWFVFVKLKKCAVTAQMEVKLKKPAIISKGAFKLVASLIEVKRNIAQVHVDLFDGEQELCAVATMHYFIYPDAIAKTKMNFPDAEEF